MKLHYGEPQVAIGIAFIVISVMLAAVFRGRVAPVGVRRPLRARAGRGLLGAKALARLPVWSILQQAGIEPAP